MEAPIMGTTVSTAMCHSECLREKQAICHIGQQCGVITAVQLYLNHVNLEGRGCAHTFRVLMKIHGQSRLGFFFFLVFEGS